jgi:hypothetical protein
LGPSDQPAKVTIKETVVGYRPMGAAADVAGLSRLNESVASATVTLNELSLAVLQMILHNITPVVGTAATTSPSGLATTLSADVALGATAIVVTAATNVATGKYLKVGDALETEIVKVGTYVSGLTLNLTTPLIRAHDAGDAVVMVDDAGTTILQQRVGMIPVASYKDFVFQAVGPDGEPAVVTIFNSLSDGTFDVSFGEASPAGTSVTFTGHVLAADPTLAPWSWERLTP